MSQLTKISIFKFSLTYGDKITAKHYIRVKLYQSDFSFVYYFAFVSVFWDRLKPVSPEADIKNAAFVFSSIFDTQKRQSTDKQKHDLEKQEKLSEFFFLYFCVWTP